MRQNPSYTALLRPTRLLISEKSNTYTIKWSYTIIWQVRVCTVRLLILKFSQKLNPENVIMQESNEASNTARVCLFNFFHHVHLIFFENIQPCVLIWDWLLIRVKSMPENTTLQRRQNTFPHSTHTSSTSHYLSSVNVPDRSTHQFFWV